MLAIVAAAAFFTRDQWRDMAASFLRGDAQSFTPQLTAIEEKLDKLGREQQALGNRLAATETEVINLHQQLKGLGDRIEGVALTRPPTVDEAIPAIDERVELLRRRTDSLEYRAENLEQRAERLARETEDLAQQVAALVAEPARTEALVQRIAQLEADSLQAKRLADTVRELETIAAVKGEEASRLAATLLAVNQLHDALRGSGPFETQLRAVIALAGDDPELMTALEPLKAHAGRGVTTLDGLRSQFPAVASAAVRAQSAVTGEGWAERTVNRLTSLVTVRRVGPDAVAAGGLDGLLAEAEQALEADDLARAVKAVAAIEGRGSEAAADWLASARARLAADTAMADLRGRMIARLGTGRS